MPPAAIALAMLVDIVPVGNVPAEVKRAASTALRSVYDCDVTVNDPQSVPKRSLRLRSKPVLRRDVHSTRRTGRPRHQNIAITLTTSSTDGATTSSDWPTSTAAGASSPPTGCRPRATAAFESERRRHLRGPRPQRDRPRDRPYLRPRALRDNNRCVMNFSPTVREVDIKEENLCGSCQRLIS